MGQAFAVVPPEMIRFQLGQKHTLFKMPKDGGKVTGLGLLTYETKVDGCIRGILAGYMPFQVSKVVFGFGMKEWGGHGLILHIIPSSIQMSWFHGCTFTGAQMINFFSFAIPITDG